MVYKVDETLDQEWIDLIVEALEKGITVDEMKAFFSSSNQSA